jgi:hypothetical protein
MKKIKILFLAANPKDSMQQKKLAEEMHSIDQALSQAEYRDKFEIDQKFAVRVKDLANYLLACMPDIVHFSGQSSDSNEIVLEDESGNSQPVPTAALSKLFSILKDNIRCVVLNACYSDPQAQAISKDIDCVIGMSGAIEDAASIEFSAAFYGALGFGKDVKTAFDLGCLQIELQNLNDQDKPKLIAERTDPKNIFLLKGKIGWPGPGPGPEPDGGLTNDGWEALLRRIKNGQCTPFLGPGVNAGILPPCSEIAKDWSEKYNYPLEDCSDLANVSQFLEFTRSETIFPIEEIIACINTKFKEWQDNVNSTEFLEKNDEPVSVLSKLPFPLYINTNYDDILFWALKMRNKEPSYDYCRWKKELLKTAAGKEVEPNPEHPLVYHLFGHIKNPESLVLSEDDHMDFLVNVIRNGNLIPSLISRSLDSTSLIFMGFGMDDWSFRVLFRILNSSEAGTSMRRISVAVQITPYKDKNKNEIMRQYFTKYFDKIKVKVYWGTTNQFATELKERWENFNEQK